MSSSFCPAGHTRSRAAGGNPGVSPGGKANPKPNSKEKHQRLLLRGS